MGRYFNQPRSCCKLIFISLSCMHMFASGALATDAPDVNEWHHIRERAIRGLAGLASSVAECSASASEVYDVLVSYIPSDRDFYTRSEMKLDWRPGAGKLVVDSYDRAGKHLSHRVHVYNSEYSFRAERSAGSGEYYLTDLSHPPSQGYLKERSFIDFKTSLARASVTDLAGLEPLHEFLLSEAAQPVSARPAIWQGLDVVEIKYVVPPTEFQASINAPPAEVIALLDPQNSWRALRYSLDDGRVSGEKLITYPSQADMPAAVESVGGRTTVRDPGPDGRMSVDESVFRVLSLEPRTFDDAEFTLAAVGLPELDSLRGGGSAGSGPLQAVLPLGQGDRNRALLFWGVGLLTLSLVLYVLYRASRRRVAAGPVSSD